MVSDDTNNHMVVINKEEHNALNLFKKDGLSEIIQNIEAEARSQVSDVESVDGRKQIASLAHKISKTKTAIDRYGKNLSDELNKTLKPINAERKKARDRLDLLRDEIRLPLTNYENAEKERIASHRENIDWIKECHTDDSFNSKQFDDLLDGLKGINIEDYEEFAAECAIAKDRAIKHVETLIKIQKQQEDDKEKQRVKDEESRLQAEREKEEKRQKKIEKDKSKAVLDAIEKQKKQHEKEIEDQQLKSKSDKLSAAKAIQEQKDLHEKKLFEQKVRERLAEEQRNKATQDKIDRQNEEKRIIAAEKLATEKADKLKRENIVHQTSIRKGILELFIRAGIEEEKAIAVIKMIHKMQVPNLTINY